MVNLEPKVAIIITTFNQKKLLIRCLKSLKKTSYKNYSVFFVDDSGKGEIGSLISKKFKKVHVYKNDKNLGFSKSNNIGIKNSIKEYNPDYFLLLNDDTETIQANWLSKIIEVGQSNPKIGILGCKIIYPNGRLQNLGGYVKGWNITKEKSANKKRVFEVDHVMGAFMMIKNDVVNKIGLLDEHYSPYLLEDTDYCINAKKEGFKVVSVPNVKIIHNKGKSISTKENYERKFIRYKNDVYFSKKNLHGWNKFFRTFIYLPLVAIFKKNRDEDSLNPINFRIRKDFIGNLKIYFKVIFNHDKNR